MPSPTERYLSEEIKQNQKIYTQFLDTEYSTKMAKVVLDQIDAYYFRSRFIGFDELPQRNNPDHPLIYASNHSGMAFPWDAIMFTSQFFRRNNYQWQHSVRAVAAPMLSQSLLMNPFLIKDLWRKGGAIDATFANFETMMFYKDSNLLVYPEGVPGIGKGFDKRYQLQRFATSYIRLSLKYKTDIMPFATVNAEYINPYNLRSETINKLANKIGIPFLPVGLMTLLVPLQPWLFYFGFPAKLTYVMGKRIKTYEMVDKPYEDISEEEIKRIRDTVKDQMQAELNEAVRQYGQKPYEIKEFFSICWRNKKKFPFFLPCFWPSIFNEFDRLYRQGRIDDLKIGIVSGIRSFFRNPIMIAFFLPIIGWIPIFIRGLTKVELMGKRVPRRQQGG